MRRSVTVLVVILPLAAVGAASCSPPSRMPATSIAPVLQPQMDGVVAVPGLSAPVTVVRDEWGVPHITASTTADLFFAQGFVQAQDRLFQMDLWRRASLGRLAEVLGANFIQRDAMTRRMQYRGDIDAEWRAYAPGTREIVTAFTSGVNAWIDHSRHAWPDEFRLAGWTPARWEPEDLLNRTDAFVSSAGVQDEVFRARLAAVIGAGPAGTLFGDLRQPGQAPAGVDLDAITAALAETVMRAGSRAFFVGFAAPYPSGSNAWAVGGGIAASGSPLLAIDPHRTFEAPSPRYLVHLSAPGWHVAGATAPWLPGVAIGHNDHLAWGMTAASPDVQDLYVEHVNPVNPRQVRFRDRWVDMTVVPDSVAVKGRSEPFEYERQYTPHGVVIGVDRERHLAYALRWSGAEPGAAAELPVLALLRATTAAEFEAGLASWKMPAVDVIVAARSGDVRQGRAAFEPVRRRFDGRLPQDGRMGAYEWSGWRPRNALVAAAGGIAVTANNDSVRTSRIIERLRAGPAFDAARLAGIQRDVHARDTDTLLSPLERFTFSEPSLVEARRRLLAWNREMRADSDEARLFAAWARQVRVTAARGAVPTPFVDGLVERISLADSLRLLAKPLHGTPAPAHDSLFAETLTAALRATASAESRASWDAAHAITFVHPLALSPVAKEEFNVGPFTMSGGPHTIQLIDGGGRIGAALRAVFDTADWDRSLVVNAPGQAGWPKSPHYRDLAQMWAEGKTFPLVFSPAAVQRAARQTLTLHPAVR